MSYTSNIDNDRPPIRPEMDESKKTIIIYSPDLNLCFSLSMVFQDKYNVITTTNLGMLEKFVGIYSADLLVLDAEPTQKLMERIDRLRGPARILPVIILYVYNNKEGVLDRAVRNHVDSVFYKPLEISAVSRRIDELLAV
jgi:DNA-binding response OmpR family regulator